MLGERIRNLLPASWHERHPLVAVLRLNGPIGAVTPLRPGLSLADLESPLKRAFKMKRAAAVAISINSPGGSPVQSRLIYKRIRDLAEENGKPVFVFIEDIGASGGYMLALAGDEIVADPTSLVGSIGVVAATFGFDKAIEKLGIERRVYTAGDRKVMLDSFQPEKPEDVRRIKAIQKDVHGVFIDMVKARRGSALNGTDRLLFSGEFWSGSRALELGLIDRLGDLTSVMRERYGDKVRLVPIATARRGLLRRLRPFSSGPAAGPGLTAGFADDLISAIEARALWSRFGL
ncbi:S49 family peptidase [Microbaculum marinum]|uniref:S49 family peptidase n=1 Tax=Microbaculum marinum TaxID=1764581 RepID=A0AAW9RTV2_9HYPH